MSRPDPKSGILVEIHQGGRLIAALPLGVEPIEVTLRDIRSGLPLGTLSAKGPSSGHIDETPMRRPVRAPEDDITMPFPEATASNPYRRREPTGDLDAEALDTETAEAPRPGTQADRKVPNLARSAWGHTTDEATSPAMPTATMRLADHEESLTVPRPSGMTRARRRESTLSEALEPIESSEETLSGMLEYVGTPATVPPAEVWTRTASEWRSAGRLKPGQSAKAREGWVRLETDGSLWVHPGPELEGTATMTDGNTREIRKGGPRVRLPPGSSVILRGTGHGLYVRTDPPLPSL